MRSAEPKHRRPGRPKAPTLEQDFFTGAREYAAQASILAFPCVRYQTDIIGFARDVMGFTPCRTLAELVAIRDDEDARNVPEHERRLCLWPTQIEILEAAMREERVSVASGHKISKSHTAGIAALWFYSCFHDAKVVFSSTTYHQVESILWAEFRRLRYRAKVSIPGDMHEVASSGFKSDDFRVVQGFTAKEPEAIAGISGKNLFFILDEASGIPDKIAEAIEGNRAGGAKLLLFSNPTKTSGFFFDSHHKASKAQLGPNGFYCFQISSETTPNAMTGRRLIPGLATRDYCVAMREEWGVDSAFYKVRILGQFVKNEEGKPFSLELISASEARWLEAVGEGRLHIGVDPAGPGENGDESGFAVRRGRKVLFLAAYRGLTESQHLDKVLELLRAYRLPSDILEMSMPVVAVDREGPIGFKVWLTIKVHFDDPKRDFSAFVLGERASDKAFRRPDIYDNHRDELWGSLEAWIKDGGAIPTDAKLEKELEAIEWSSNVRNRLKATSKDDIRKAIGRSPDRADALCLATWEPSGYRSVQADPDAQQAAQHAPPPRVDPYQTIHAGAGAFDPYAGMR
jgi:phage terminase large subunit